MSYQEIKLQEPADQVPVGHVPRTINVVAKGEITRQCGPGIFDLFYITGDMVTIHGVFLTTPFDGLRGIKAGLVHVSPGF